MKLVVRAAFSAVVRDEVRRYLRSRDQVEAGRRLTPVERVELDASAAVEAGRLEERIRRSLEALVAPVVAGEVVYL